MAISIGFFKYVQRWIADSKRPEIVYRPFEAGDNPYRASVYIVCAHPSPTLSLHAKYARRYADALVDQNSLLELFPNYMKSTSRDVKGAYSFAQDLRYYGISSVITYVNALTANNANDLKQMKKDNAAQYNRGFEIFKEVIAELKPPVLLLNGAFALEHFRSLYKNYFIEYGHFARNLTELMDEGMFGKLVHDDGKETLVFATKSLSFYNSDDEKYNKLLKQIAKETIKVKSSV